MPQPLCSVIVPVLNDGRSLDELLNVLEPLRAAGHEIVVVDGGSEDNPVQLAAGRVDHFLTAAAGRARQMNRGAEAASGDIFWFLHADSQLDVMACVAEILSLGGSDRVWGRFDVRLSGNDWRLRMVEKTMNLRSRLSGIATGDQGIFVTRNAFEKLQGFKEIPLMEDIDISRSLKRISPPMLPRQTITTSSRRWEHYGVFRTIMLMWTLRLGYALGFSTQRLARYYRSCSSPMPKS